MISSNAIDKQVGTQLQILRVFAGLTIDQCADRMSVRGTELVDYERGRRRIVPGMLIRLADALGVPISKFFWITQPPESAVMVPGSLVGG